MHHSRQLVAILVLLLAISVTNAQVYKWTDASGQVHYSQRKPDDVTPVQTLGITPSAPTTPANTDSVAEVARLNALSEQMARERQAAEQARQEQAIRNLELANQQLQNDVLNQQLQQQSAPPNDTSNGFINSYPPPYPYPPSPPPQPFSPHPQPCEPWPTCHSPMPMPMPTPRPQPLAKPNPPFNPAPARMAPELQGVFRGR